MVRASFIFVALVLAGFHFPASAKGNCPSIDALAKPAHKNFQGVPLKAANGEQFLATPVGGARYCVAEPQAAVGAPAMLFCLYAAPSEAAARASYQAYLREYTGCRKDGRDAGPGPVSDATTIESQMYKDLMAADVWQFALKREGRAWHVAVTVVANPGSN